MEERELLAIASEVMSAVRKFVAESEEDAKYGEIIGRREKDVTRRIDMVAERALEHALEKRGICAHIFSEELGDRIFPEGRKPECTLVFDPIDGSSNAAAGIPFYCSSLAYSPEISSVKFNDIRAGVVIPIFGKIYHAVDREDPNEKIPRNIIKEMEVLQIRAEKEAYKFTGHIYLQIAEIYEQIEKRAKKQKGHFENNIPTFNLSIFPLSRKAFEVYSQELNKTLSKITKIIEEEEKEILERPLMCITSTFPLQEFYSHNNTE